jgi:ACR3 family arsenite efflux pump ArsB
MGKALGADIPATQPLRLLPQATILELTIAVAIVVFGLNSGRLLQV